MKREQITAQVQLAREISGDARRHLREVGLRGYRFEAESMKRMFAVYDIPTDHELGRALGYPSSSFSLDPRMVAGARTRGKMAEIIRLMADTLTTSQHFREVPH